MIISILISLLFRAVDTLERLRSMKVAKADRDNIALERRDFSGQKHLHFAHSGTRFGTKVWGTVFCVKNCFSSLFCIRT
jgi:hypothetical protein